MSICVLPLLLLLLGLGFWQLARGEEKARLQQLQLDRLSALAVAPPAQVQGADFLRVRIRGAFERGKYFLVDNQVLNGRAGYWVLHSFQAIDGGRWLVNRGWVDAGARRTELPEVAEPAGTVELMGVCWPDLGLLPILSDEVWSGGWPKRVPRMNIPAMADMLGAEPVEVRLEPGQPGRLGALPMSVALDAHRHRGYAVQWFGLALILLAGYALHGYRGLAGNRA